MIPKNKNWKVYWNGEEGEDGGGGGGGAEIEGDKKSQNPAQLIFSKKLILPDIYLMKYGISTNQSVTCTWLKVCIQSDCKEPVI